MNLQIIKLQTNDLLHKGTSRKVKTFISNKYCKKCKSKYPISPYISTPRL